MEMTKCLAWRNEDVWCGGEVEGVGQVAMSIDSVVAEGRERSIPGHIDHGEDGGVGLPTRNFIVQAATHSEVGSEHRIFTFLRKGQVSDHQ